jgi:hypothetical protein
MCHSKQLNQYQQNNLEILAGDTLEKLKQGNWSNAPTLILKCVKCGKNKITMPIVAYYGFCPTKILCYDCQKLYGYKRLQQNTNKLYN